MTAASALFAPSCLIGGSEIGSEQVIEVHYPYTGAVVGTVPALPPDVVAGALTLAGDATVALDRYERSCVLDRVSRAIAAAADELAALIAWESGLCLRDTRHEVSRSTDVFAFAAREVLRDDGDVYACDVSVNGRARRAFTSRQPVRLVAAITPFNHPLNQVAHKVAPAIAAGAPIVLKPSEKTPLAALWLGRAVLEAGYPPDALAIVTGDPRAVLSEMLGHEAVEVVAFTGGIPVGREIASRAGFRRTILELGGNDPLIVLADADLTEAADLAVSGATRNSGQRCTAVKRIIADERIADTLTDLIEAKTRGLVVGDPFADATDIGTLIDEDAAVTVESRVVGAVAAGARLLCGGERTGAQIIPPVLDHVPAHVELVREETFGPAVPVIRVGGLDEAIAVANGTVYGLSVGLVTNDLDAVNRCVKELRCGTVNVREVPGFRTEQTPFGGIKQSGLGAKEGVVEAIRGMTTVKLVTLPWL